MPTTLSDVEKSFAALAPAGIEPDDWEAFVAVVQDGTETDPTKIATFLQRSGKTPADLTAGRERLQERRRLRKIVDNIPDLEAEVRAAEQAVIDNETAAKLAAENVEAEHAGAIRVARKDAANLRQTLQAAQEARRLLSAGASAPVKLRREKAAQACLAAADRRSNLFRNVAELRAAVERQRGRMKNIDPTARVQQQEEEIERDIASAEGHLHQAEKRLADAEKAYEAAQKERKSANAAMFLL